MLRDKDAASAAERRMKTDNQHLDYLISQYVDGCLDTASKKSLEQKLLTDPVSRQLYKEQREVQEVLDDWGNRIPMINWDEFDKKLASRLEHETVGGGSISIFRRWAKPMSAAAALFIAATIGYSWHAWSTTPLLNPGITTGPIPAPRPSTPVIIHNMNEPGTASHITFKIDEVPSELQTASGGVTVLPPDDALAAKSMTSAVEAGLQGVASAVKTPAPIAGQGAAASAFAPEKTNRNDRTEKEPGPAFP